ASFAACSAATVAAKGVDFLEPLKPAFPALPHTTAFPAMSVIVMIVLLKVAWMNAIPSASTLRFVRARPPCFGFAIGFLYLLLPGLLLARNRPPRTLFGSRVGMRPLASHGQPAPVTNPSVRPDVDQTLDVARNLRPQHAFYAVAGIDHAADPVHLLVREMVHSNGRIHPR